MFSPFLLVKMRRGKVTVAAAITSFETDIIVFLPQPTSACLILRRRGGRASANKVTKMMEQRVR